MKMGEHRAEDHRDQELQHRGARRNLRCAICGLAGAAGGERARRLRRRARRLGAPFARLDWFPDWQGETAILIGGGPSLRREQCARASRLGRVIAINRAFELYPDADVLYACDAKFWRWCEPAREFPGLKISQDARACADWPAIRRVVSRPGNAISLELGIIGQGGNSGFQALNLAIQFGATRIVLLGFDMAVGGATHWHGDHPAPLANPDEHTCRRWRDAFAAAAPAIAALGVSVINATPGSALDCFAREPIEALACG